MMPVALASGAILLQVYSCKNYWTIMANNIFKRRLEFY